MNFAYLTKNFFLTCLNTVNTINTDMTFFGKEPIYIQIANYYKKLIIAGAYHYQDMLPSVREVALELIVNPNTVQRAFSKLEEDGFVIAIPKKGYFVAYESKSVDRNAPIRKVLESLIEQGYSLKEIKSVVKEMEEE